MPRKKRSDPAVAAPKRAPKTPLCGKDYRVPKVPPPVVIKPHELTGWERMCNRIRQRYGLPLREVPDADA